MFGGSRVERYRPYSRCVTFEVRYRDVTVVSCTVSCLSSHSIKMDLAKLSNEKKLYLCRWYFRAGFALLPFLWAVNSIWFAKQAFVTPHFEEQKQIRKYVIFSGVGAILWIAALVAWIVTFQTQRAAWGQFADSITYIFPTGIP